MENNFQDLDESFEHVFGKPYDKENFRFRLFDLPPELWLRIIEYAVMKACPINPTKARNAKHQTHIVKQPSITRTCRLLRHESLPAFYRNNKFEVYHWGRVACIRDWLVAIRPANLQAMKTLTFHCKFDPDFWTEKFADIGLLVKIEVAEDQSKASGSFHTLIVTFL